MKRKTLTALAAFAAAALVLLAACAPGVGDGENKFGGTEAQEITIFTEGNTHIDLPVSTTALAYALDYGALYNTTGQIIDVELNYPIDVATVSTAIQLYALGNNVLVTDVNELSSQGTALPITSATLLSDDNITGDYLLRLVVNLTDASEWIELRIDAATLTGETNQMLDGDGDGIQGELNDGAYLTLPVAQAVEVTTTVPPTVDIPTVRVPVNPPSFTFANFGTSQTIDSDTFNNSDVANQLRFVLVDTGSSAAASNKVSYANAVAGYRWDAATASWVDAGATISVEDNTTDLTCHVVFSPPPAKNQCFKVVFDMYNIVETVDVLGFKHRVEEDADSPTRYITNYYYFHQDAAVTQQTFDSVSSGGQDYNTYIEFTASTGSPIDLATVNPANLRIKLGQGTILANGTTLGAGAYVYAQYAVADVIAMEHMAWDDYYDCVARFRIYLPNSIRSLPTAVNRVTIEVSPSVSSIDDSGHTVIGFLSFGDIDDITGVDGWRTILY